MYWVAEFNDFVKDWLKFNAPDILDQFNYSLLLEKEIYWTTGRNTYRWEITGAQDRNGKNSVYNVIPNKWIPFEEQPKRTFAECMFESAQDIANKGKTIDFFWSGGLDSNGVLLAFNELGLHKQLHVIMGGETESPELFEKIVKGRMDYTITDETSNLATLYGISKPDKHLWTSGCESDLLLGCKSNMNGRGNPRNEDYLTEEELKYRWNTNRRYNSSNRLYRYAENFDGDWIDINNHSTFYMHESLERWAINHVIDENMVYWDPCHEDYGDPLIWHRNIGYNESSAYHKYFLKCKMPLRDFIYSVTKDKFLSYQMGEGVSLFRLKYERVADGQPPRKKPNATMKNIAFLDDGTVVTRENFNDFDWTEYINTK